jgi:Domain of unknown function (DUF4279)
MNDDYPTCEETYVTLRLYHDSANPTLVSAALGLGPTTKQSIGESYERRGISRTYRLSGWFLCSEGQVQSYDTAKHLDWLLQQVHPRLEELYRLRSEGWRMDIACLWDSHSGHGGPTLPPELLRRLAALGIELWFDIYFHGAYYAIQQAMQADAIQPNA